MNSLRLLVDQGITYISTQNGQISVNKFIEENYKPKIVKVIYNDPATIVYWSDSSKTVVKCAKGDSFSQSAGLALCICKKIFGDQNYRNILKKYVNED